MKASEYPVCPICKQEVLLPFSISQYELRGKIFGNWICSNCGFYLTTGDSRAEVPESDIKAGFHTLLRKKVEELRKEYYDKKH
jgi:hypothetical protein